MNECLLILSLLVIFSLTVIWYRYFGNTGLYCLTAIFTILANMEVLLIVDAFGIEQTLGNVLFASSFLVTDILSETAGKKEAQRAVLLSVMGSLVFLLISASWLLYIPAESDWAAPAFHQLFQRTPRVVLASLAVYAFTQLIDVWLYHKWWDFSTKRTGNSRPLLWLRNNGSTLISQLLNAILFNVLAFAGTPGYSPALLLSIIASSYLIYIVTSLADTPFLYLARRIKEKHNQA